MNTMAAVGAPWRKLNRPAVIAPRRHAGAAHRLDLVGADHDVRGKACGEQDRHHHQTAAARHRIDDPGQHRDQRQRGVQP
jgi:hypothetical protein